MATHRKRKHKTLQQTNQQSTVQGLMTRCLVPEDPTLDSGINVAPGTFGKNNKHSPLKKHIPLY